MQPQATRSHSKGVVRGSAGINNGEPQGARATHVIEKVLLAQNHKLLKGAALVQILPGAHKATLWHATQFAAPSCLTATYRT